ncbi:MAG: radical SAM protein [Planctomycetes bacterium]|nr:radical SAM protein [Planctomycetota bacterium]
MRGVLDKIERTKWLAGLELARRSSGFARAIDPTPNAVSFKVTANCNSLCISCTDWKEVSRGELTTEEIQDAMRQLRDLGVKNFYFSGGEPTLRRDLALLVAYATREMGFRTGMTSNGLTMTEERCRSLLEAGLGTLGFSVEGTRESHDRIRGAKGFYDRTLRSIKIAAELRKEHPFALFVGFTMMSANMDHLVPMANELAPLGVTINVGLVNFTTHQFRGADGKTMGLWVKDLARLEKVIDEALALKGENPRLFGNLSPEWKTYAMEYFKDPLGERIPCSVGFHKLYVDPYGHLYACWPLPATGNIREQTIKEILDSEKHRKTLRAMLNLQCPGCSCNTFTNRFNHLPRVVERKWNALTRALASSPVSHEQVCDQY